MSSPQFAGASIGAVFTAKTGSCDARARSTSDLTTGPESCDRVFQRSPKQRVSERDVRIRELSIAVTLVISCVTIVVGRLRQRDDMNRQRQAQTTLAGNDSGYQRSLAEWLRDSVVLDSMTRLVKTDSLYRLYRRAAEPSGVSLAVVQEAWCEGIRLSATFGVVPAERAEKRLLDTVYRDLGVRDGFRYFAAKAPASGLIESNHCRFPRAKILDSVGRTSLNEELPPRPRPAR